MTELIDHLKEMIRVSGLSGFEEPIRKIIENAWQPYADKISISKIGSLHGLKEGDGIERRGGIDLRGGIEPRPSILIATHMDAIGLIVTGVTDGLLHITEIGGIDPRILPGQLVTVHGTEELSGIVIQPPAHTLAEEYRSGVTPMKGLRVDTGLTPRQVTSKIKIGDLVSFATEPTELNGNYLAGHSLDNRASVAVLTETLKLMQSRKHEWDIWAVATVQEEETWGGAATSAYQLRPTLAVVIDVTFGKGPGVSNSDTYSLDKGPTLDWGPNTHIKLHQEFEKLAKELEIPFQNAVYPRGSGTDAMLLQVAAEGIPTMIISVPLRYMHTPVEMIQIRDIERSARLLAEFIARLDNKFMDKLAWDTNDDNEK